MTWIWSTKSGKMHLLLTSGQRQWKLCHRPSTLCSECSDGLATVHSTTGLCNGRSLFDHLGLTCFCCMQGGTGEGQEDVGAGEADTATLLKSGKMHLLLTSGQHNGSSARDQAHCAQNALTRHLAWRPFTAQQACATAEASLTMTSGADMLLLYAGRDWRRTRRRGTTTTEAPPETKHTVLRML